METCAREVAKRRSGRGSAGNIYNIGVWCGLCCMLVEKKMHKLKLTHKIKNNTPYISQNTQLTKLYEFHYDNVP